MKKTLFAIPTLLALLAFAVVMGVNSMPHAGNISSKDAVNYKAMVCMDQYRNGQLIAHKCHHNTLTDYGKDFIEQQLSGTLDNTQSVKYIAVAINNTTPSAAWTSINDLTTSGFSRAAGTYESNSGSGSWNVYYTYSVTGSETGINMTGLYTNSTGNTLFAVTTFSDTNVISGDTLKINWTITVS